MKADSVATWPPRLRLGARERDIVHLSRALANVLWELEESLMKRLSTVTQDSAVRDARAEFVLNALTVATTPPLVLGIWMTGRFKPYWTQRPLFSPRTYDVLFDRSTEGERRLLAVAVNIDQAIRALVSP